MDTLLDIVDDVYGHGTGIMNSLTAVARDPASRRIDSTPTTIDMGGQIPTIYGVTARYGPVGRARRVADLAILLAAAEGLGADDEHVGRADTVSRQPSRAGAVYDSRLGGPPFT